MTPPAGTASSYTYDGTGLLANRVNGSTSTSFAWDTSGSLSLLLTDGTNSYIYGPGGVPIEQLSSSGTPTYLHHDQTGSTRLLTSSAGAATGTQTYAPFGTSSAHTGTITTPFGFAGQYIDAHTGLQYLRARWYDPGTAQFLSVDPLSSLTRSPYTYAFDNPINLTDPNGECGALCYVGIGLGVVSAATGVGEVFAGTLGIADGLSAGVSAASGVAASTLGVHDRIIDGVMV